MTLLDATREGGGEGVMDSCKLKVNPLARAPWYLAKDILCQ